MRPFASEFKSERGDEMLYDLLIGGLVAAAYLVPIVVFALAIRPAADVVQSVGHSATAV
jgi:hypothetical protein